MYKHPGVYIEHVPSGLLAIEAASTSIAAFIGPVKRGPVGEPVFISNAGQFAEKFGVLNDGAGGIRDAGGSVDKFGHAVAAFFTNGGAKAYIVRVAKEGSGAKHLTAASTVIPYPADVSKAFEIKAKSEGTWANYLVVQLRTVDKGNPADKTLGYTLEVGHYIEDTFTVMEAYPEVAMPSDAPKYIVKVVNDNSALIKMEEKPSAGLKLRSKSVLGSVIDTSSSVVQKGKKLTMKIGSEALEIEFANDTADLGAIARHIQTMARSKAPDFVARVVTENNGDRKLHLISGIRGSEGNVNTIGGDAKTKLGFDSPAELDYPAGDLLKGTDLFEAFFAGGGDGMAAPPKSEYDKVFSTLRDYRDVSIMLLPGLEWKEGGDNSIIESAITHAEFMKNRMVIIDPPDPTGKDTLVTPKDVKDLGAPTSPYTALYYPWLEVTNPHYNPDTAAQKPRTFRVPPSGFAAGLWARIDGSRGVWKAPAGLEASVRGSLGPNILIGNDLQDNLNDQGVNCLRAIVGPTVIWGARTLATKTKPEFRYIPVRRTQNMIGESLYAALQSVVFEPNDHRLWAALRASIGNFMDGLYRAGAFQGEKASDAYYVICNLGSTMTQADVDAGIVRVVVGFAPLKPAEFVVVQIKQIVGQSAA